MLRLLLLPLGAVFSFGNDYDFTHCNLHPYFYPNLAVKCNEQDGLFVVNGPLGMSFGSAIEEIQEQQGSGQCLNPVMTNFRTTFRGKRDAEEGLLDGFTGCEFEGCNGADSRMKRATWRECDSNGVCRGDFIDGERNPNLHVILAVDMAADDQSFWQTTLPGQLTAHMKATPFPVGTTYEVIFVGPQGVLFKFPSDGNGRRHRRAAQCDDTEQLRCSPRRGCFCEPHCGNGNCSGGGSRNCPPGTMEQGSFCVTCDNDNCGYTQAQAQSDPSNCVITDREVLMQRVREVVNRVPLLSVQALGSINMGYGSGLSFMSDYLEEFTPTDKQNILFLHAISRNNAVSQTQYTNFVNFLNVYGAAHPGVKLMNHFMFADSAAPFLSKLKAFGATNGATWALSRGFLNVQATDSILGYKPPVNGGSISDNTGCASNPCLNGCTCQASCRDENDYVCVPQPGRPFVGKNCEYEAQVQCTANRSIRVSLPVAAIDQYALGVPNVVIQGCNNAPSFICNNNPSCGPATTAVGGFYTLECSNNQLIEIGGVFKFQQTFIFDRASDVISMPRPIVKVECNMQTRPATSLITPQIRDVNPLSQTIFWQPSFQFYKTAWGQPMILANNGDRLANGAVAYIIGERIHVRLVASLNGVEAQNLPYRYEMSLNSCSISSTEGGSSPILIISNGMAVQNTPFPVSVDQPIGNIGGGVPVDAMGVGFAFQVFTFSAGSSLQLTCTVSINNGRRRRDAEEGDASVTGRSEESVVAELLLFEKGYDNEEEIPVFSVEQEPSRAMLMERPGFESPEVISEEISAENLPVWIMVLCASSVVLSALFGGLFYRRNYVVKPHFDMDDTKARLFN